MSNNDNDNNPVLLSNGRYVDADIFDIVCMYVGARIPVLSPDPVYTLKQICGDDFWSTLSPGDQKRAGWIMVHLVQRGLVPFMSIEGRHEYPKLYQLNSTKLGTRIP